MITIRKNGEEPIPLTEYVKKTQKGAQKGKTYRIIKRSKKSKTYTRRKIKHGSAWKRNTKRYKNDGTEWTYLEVKELEKMVGEGISHLKISQQLKRTRTSVQMKLYNLKKSKTIESNGGF